MRFISAWLLCLFCCLIVFGSDIYGRYENKGKNEFLQIDSNMNYSFILDYDTYFMIRIGRVKVLNDSIFKLDWTNTCEIRPLYSDTVEVGNSNTVNLTNKIGITNITSCNDSIIVNSQLIGEILIKLPESKSANLNTTRFSFVEWTTFTAVGYRVFLTRNNDLIPIKEPKTIFPNDSTTEDVKPEIAHWYDVLHRVQ